MKVWLIGLGLTLLCSVLAVDGFDDDAEQVTGKWHAVAIRTDCEEILDYEDNLKILIAYVEFEDDGSLEISFNIPLPGGCQKITIKFKKKESGQYIHMSGWGNFTIEDYEMDYKNWFAVKTKNESKGETCEMIWFYSRDRKITDEEKDSFKKFCLNHGYNEDGIIFMPPEVACAESQ